MCALDATLPEALSDALAGADFVFHLAGINRPKDAAEFITGARRGFTQTLCGTLKAIGSRPPIAFTSSTQAELDNPYGQATEQRLPFGSTAPIRVRQLYFRLTNVFGKWAMPN